VELGALSLRSAPPASNAPAPAVSTTPIVSLRDFDTEGQRICEVDISAQYFLVLLRWQTRSRCSAKAGRGDHPSATTGRTPARQTPAATPRKSAPPPPSFSPTLQLPFHPRTPEPQIQAPRLSRGRGRGVGAGRIRSCRRGCRTR